MAGARTMAAVSPELRAALSRGEAESRTLVESLVVDFNVLVGACFADVCKDVGEVDASLGIIKRMEFVAARLVAAQGARKAFDRCAGHRSDTVRGIACYVLRDWPRLTLAGRLDRVRRLADDPHAGVREWAWIALRPHVSASLDEAITLLTPWTDEASPNLRRYASEITRPRGVWCAHIARLKESPEIVLPILDPLSADPAKYVQDSVGNWLNDAARTRPEWVRETCERWRATAAGTPGERFADRIARRGLRNLSGG